MTPSEYYWKRPRSPGTERWLLHERWPDSDLERIVGAVAKATNKRRCHRWDVRWWNDDDFVWQTVAVLKDMKAAEAQDAAKLILLSLKEHS